MMVKLESFSPALSDPLGDLHLLSSCLRGRGGVFVDVDSDRSRPRYPEDGHARRDPSLSKSRGSKPRVKKGAFQHLSLHGSNHVTSTGQRVPFAAPRCRNRKELLTAKAGRQDAVQLHPLTPQGVTKEAFVRRSELA